MTATPTNFFVIGWRYTNSDVLYLDCRGDRYVWDPKITNAMSFSHCKNALHALAIFQNEYSETFAENAHYQIIRVTYTCNVEIENVKMPENRNNAH